MENPPAFPPPPVEPGAPGPPPGPPPRSRRTTPIVAAIVAIALGAIVGTVLFLTRSDEPDRGVKAGWSRETVPAEGFTVDLPPGWNSVPTTSADEAFETLKDANPELADLVKDQLGASLSSLIKLLAFDVESPTLEQQFATNLNVVVAPTEGGVVFDTFLQQNLNQLRNTPNLTSVNSQRTTLPAGESALVTSQLTVNAPGGAQKVAISQYLLLGNDRGYILSFSTLPSHAAGYASLFREIAGTFRID